ncbi:transglutaminase family protein [Allostreptomyces psammosilenae]|uniref:Transglutaminase-like putative cysteine protease n=1 Tax=Allostreptomyces psammosilenae TaxID=1892865 RepID=A0A852ZY34_9ACTN|nr:DUF3488 and transglutaminase-like domain-containing protein [Allostreptomyces psammosilenae]NYI07089.1 transglutaminase-like putative cysteine protease [Allostreptomyces psammosilenae]
MSGPGARMTLIAALAVLLNALSLVPLLDSRVWFSDVVLVVAALALSGMAARAALGALPAPVPRLGLGLVPVVQLLVGLVVVAELFAPGTGALGLLPEGGTLPVLGELLSAGSADVRLYAVPAPATPGIGLLLAVGLGVVALAVDAFAVTWSRPALAGLPLLAVHSVVAGIAGDVGSRWGYFAAGAFGYLLLLFQDARSRSARWGTLLAGTPGPGEPRPVGAGPRGGLLAVGAVVAAVLLPLAVPGPGDGLLQGPRGGSGGGTGSTITAVNPMVTMKDNLTQNDHRTALRYRFLEGEVRNTEMYLRIVALDQFDGQAWTPSNRPVERLPPTRWPPNPDDLPAPAGLDAEEVSTNPATVEITAAPWYQQGWLPMPYPATAVWVSQPDRWRFEPAGRTVIGENGMHVGGETYGVRMVEVEPTGEQLRRAGPAPDEIRREYLALPDDLPEVVREYADQVTAGASNAYERAVALERWFARSGEFEYSTAVDGGTGGEAMARFLDGREGYCEHFASTMAAMARHLGIPARVAVGFVPGTATGSGDYTVAVSDAHAWPELYFEGAGWVRFEPTPSRGNPPDWSLEPQTDPAPDSTRAPAESQPLPSASASASASPDCDVQRQQRGDCGVPEPAGAGSGGGGGAFPFGTVLAVLAAVLAVALAVAPMLLRLRARRSRLGSAASGPRWASRLGSRWRGRRARGGAGGGAGAGPGLGGALTAAGAAARADEAVAEERRLRGQVLQLWREVSDSAWDLGSPPGPQETPRDAGRRWASMGPAGAAAGSDAYGAAVDRLVRATEQASYGASARGLADRLGPLTEDVERIRAGMLASVGRGTRVRAVLLPRSSARTLREAADRFAAARQAWLGRLRRALRRDAARPGGSGKPAEPA